MKNIKNWLISAYNKLSFKDFNKLIVTEDDITYLEEFHNITIRFDDGRVAKVKHTVGYSLDTRINKLVLAVSNFEIQNDDVFTNSEHDLIDTLLFERFS